MLPLPNLDDRVFGELTDDVRKLIHLIDPGWTDHNIHDPGVTLADLFCWLTEALSFYLNNVGGRNYLKYLQLLSVIPEDARSAACKAAFAPYGTEKKPIEFAKGAKIKAGDIYFETGAPLWAHPLKLTGAISSAGGTVINYPAGGDSFYAFGENPAPGGMFYMMFSSAPGAYQLPVGKSLSLYFEFERAAARCETTVIEDSAVSLFWEYFSPNLKGWFALETVRDETRGMRGDGFVILRAPVAAAVANRKTDGLALASDVNFSVRARMLNGGGCAGALKIRNIYINAVPAAQTNTECGFRELYWDGYGAKAYIDGYNYNERGKFYFLQYKHPDGYWRDFARTMFSISFKADASAAVTIRNKTIPSTDENGVRLRLVSFGGRLPVYKGTGYPCQSAKLPLQNALRDSLRVMVRERVVSGGKTAYEWFDWERVESFDASGPSDRHYVYSPAESLVCFGDGLNGAVPKHIRQFPYNIRVVSLASCEGAAGNVAAGKINRLGGDIPDLNAVPFNFCAAAGGRDAETVPAAIGRMRGELTLTSAVTAADYERLALAAPGADAARVKAVPIYTADADEDGNPAGTQTYAVYVAVAPYAPGDAPAVADERFLRAVEDYIDPFRLLTTRVCVVPPKYAAISVSANVRFKSGFKPDARAVAARLNAFLSPLGDGKSNEGWPFGKTVYVSDVYDVIKKTEGVDFVGDVALNAGGGGFVRKVRGNVEISPIGLTYGERHAIGIL